MQPTVHKLKQISTQVRAFPIARFFLLTAALTSQIAQAKKLKKPTDASISILTASFPPPDQAAGDVQLPMDNSFISRPNWRHTASSWSR